jgi:hypothetical protein
MSPQQSALVNFLFACGFYVILYQIQYACMNREEYECYAYMLQNRYLGSPLVFLGLLLHFIYHCGSAVYDFIYQSHYLSTSMIIHHIVNVILQLLAMWGQFHLEFLFIAYLSAISDVPMYLLRGYRKEYQNKHQNQYIEYSLAIWTWFSWCWHRLYLWAWFLCLLYQYSFSEHVLVLKTYVCFGSLVVIWLLNIYWICILTRKMISEMIFSQAKNIENEN